jgi:hypothetical protein
MSYESIKNYQEQVVHDLIVARAHRFPRVAASEDLCADVACVALNALKARYIRHEVDLHFFMTDEERTTNAAAAIAAVDAAFRFIESRLDAPSREADRAVRYG